MGLLDVIKRIFGKAPINTQTTLKASEADQPKLPTIPFDPVIFDFYEKFFQQIIPDVEGISDDDKPKVLTTIKECHGLVLNRCRAFNSLYEDVFSGRKWSWGEYEKWDELFEELGKRPGRFPRWLTAGGKQPDINEILPTLTVSDLKTLCIEQRIEIPTKAKKSELLNALSSMDELKAHPLVQAAVDRMREKEGKTIYGHLIRTIIFRATDQYNYKRASNAGFTKFSLMHFNDDEIEFVEMALKADPNCSLPAYPTSFTIRRPVRK